MIGGGGEEGTETIGDRKKFERMDGGSSVAPGQRPEKKKDMQTRKNLMG